MLSVALLWWLFRRVDGAKVWDALCELSPWAVAASAVVICLSIPLRAQQWRWLLDGAPEVSAWLSIRAISLGNLVNALVPARGGEVVKAWLLARWSGLPFARLITSLAIARVLDLGCILVLLGLMFAFVPLADGISVAAGTDLDSTLSVSRQSLDVAMRTFAAIALTSGTLLVLLGLGRARVGAWVRAGAVRLSPSAANSWDRLWTPIQQALGVIQRPGHFWGAVGLNLACWLLFVMTPVPMLLAMGLDLPGALITALGIVGFTTLAQLIPAAPTGLGTFHATCLVGILICCPEIERERAVAFTLVFHPVDTLAAGLPGLLMLPGAWRDLWSVRRRRARGSDATDGSRR